MKRKSIEKPFSGIFLLPNANGKGKRKKIIENMTHENGRLYETPNKNIPFA